MRIFTRYNNISMNRIPTHKCSTCGKNSYGTCDKCWTMCQTCGRGMHTYDSSSISVEGFEDADFCIQCSSNLFAFDNVVDSNAIIRFANTVRSFVHFLGMTNVIFLLGTTTCVVCKHRIPCKRSCCDECSYSYLCKQLGQIFPKSHVEEIISYMRKYDE